jgi:hypothetical protein
MTNLEGKRIFILVAGSDKLNAGLESVLNSHFKNLSIYTATDGADAVFN